MARGPCRYSFHELRIVIDLISGPVARSHKRASSVRLRTRPFVHSLYHPALNKNDNTKTGVKSKHSNLGNTRFVYNSYIDMWRLSARQPRTETHTVRKSTAFLQWAKRKSLRRANLNEIKHTSGDSHRLQHDTPPAAAFLLPIGSH